MDAVMSRSPASFSRPSIDRRGPHHGRRRTTGHAAV